MAAALQGEVRGGGQEPLLPRGVAAMAAEPAAPKLKANATYTEMITSAILDLNDRTGSSAPAITSWIAKHYPKLKVKKTTVGAKIRPLVQSGYLVRAKSSFKLSAATRDQLRKAKVAKERNKANKKKESAGTAKKDRGLDQISRVRKHLGLLPLVSNHHVFDDLTQVIAEHSVSPVRRDAEKPADRPKKQRKTSGGKKAQPVGSVSPTAVAAAMQPGTAAMPTASMSLMRGSGRAKSSYNFYQDYIKPTIRKEMPGLSMQELRKEMMARWNAMSAEEKEPFERQGAMARELKSQMQAASKSAADSDAAPTNGSLDTSSAAVADSERSATVRDTGIAGSSRAVSSFGSAEMATNGAVDVSSAGSTATSFDGGESAHDSSQVESAEMRGNEDIVQPMDAQGDDMDFT